MRRVQDDASALTERSTRPMAAAEIYSGPADTGSGGGRRDPTLAETPLGRKRSHSAAECYSFASDRTNHAFDMQSGAVSVVYTCATPLPAHYRHEGPATSTFYPITHGCACVALVSHQPAA